MCRGLLLGDGGGFLKGVDEFWDGVERKFEIGRENLRDRGLMMQEIG